MASSDIWSVCAVLHGMTASVIENHFVVVLVMHGAGADGSWLLTSPRHGAHASTSNLPWLTLQGVALLHSTAVALLLVFCCLQATDVGAVMRTGNCYFVFEHLTMSSSLRLHLREIFWQQTQQSHSQMFANLSS
jgi:hypothetical protein